MSNPFRNIPFFYGDSKTASLTKKAVELLPNSNPGFKFEKKWVWRSPEYFMQKHNPGIVFWSKTHSYHMLLVNGHKVLRMWSNHPNKSRLEVNETLYYQLVNKVPEPTIKAVNKFYGRFQIMTTEEVELVIQEVKRIYGI